MADEEVVRKGISPDLEWLSYRQRELSAKWDRRERDDLPFRPGKILELGQRDPVVGSYLAAWKQGQCSWDECLAMMVVHLVEQKDRLLKEAVKAYWRKPPDVPLMEK